MKFKKSEKFTAIYVENWLAGSHMQFLTKMARIERNDGETPEAMLKREGLEDNIVYLFVGWPRLQGEEEGFEYEKTQTQSTRNPRLAA